MANRDRYRDQLQITNREVDPNDLKIFRQAVREYATNYAPSLQDRRTKMKRLRPYSEGIEALIKIIKKPKQHFVMSSFNEPYTNRAGKYCGTAYCIAGYAAVLHGLAEDAVSGAGLLRKMLAGTERTAWKEQAAEEWELQNQIYNLWSGAGIDLYTFDRMPEKDRKAIAIEVLEHFAKTGKVEWRKIAMKHGYKDAD